MRSASTLSPPPGPARIAISTKLTPSKSSVLAASLLTRPPGEQAFDERTMARERYERFAASGLTTESPDFSRMGSVLSSPTGYQGSSTLGGGPGFFRNAMAPLPYPTHDGPGVDEPFPTGDIMSDAELIGQVWSFKADPEPEEPRGPVKNTKKPAENDLLASMLAISTQEESSQSPHLISPSRKQQLTERFQSSAAPFTKMFKLPTYTNESTTTSPSRGTTSLQQEVIVEVPSEEATEISLLPDLHLPHVGLASAAAAASSSAGAPVGRVLSEHSTTSDGDALERSEIKRDARKLSVIADPWFATKQATKAANLKFAADTFATAPRSQHRDVPIPAPSHAKDLEEYPPETFPITVNAVRTGQTLAETKADEARRRKREEAKKEDERREIGQKQYLKLVLRHVRTRLIQEGKFLEIPSSESGGGHHHHHPHPRSSSPSASASASAGFSGRSSPSPSPSAPELADDPGMNEYAAQLAIERRDKWKGEASPAASPKMGPSTGSMRSSKSASALSRVVTSQPLPADIAQLDVYREITGKPRPRSVGGKTPSGSPTHAGLKGSPSGGKPLPSPSPRGTPAAESLSAWSLPPPAFPFPRHARGRSHWGVSHAMMHAHQLAKEPPPPDPLAHLPFHIDPLDPSRPENVHKRYRYNQNWTPPPQGEWPLESRGPEHDWQELTDEEELLAYRKVLWLCEIKALAHITLDSMLDLLAVTIERAFDVEVLLRSGEPGDSVFFIKAGEVQLKMERKIVEEMEEQRVLTELTTSNLIGGAGEGPLALSMHPHPNPQHSTSSTSSSSSHLLPTDPDLVNKYVEIAKLGPMGICGEDILIASHRRYTVVSLTPVWVYAIKADALLKCFTDEARENFLLAIAHTQRVRERHALVKSRTRAHYHAFPTSFHHFIDESLQRPLGRASKRGGEASPGLEGRQVSPTRFAQASMSEEDRAALLFAGGGPDALRAVLQDLRSISEAQARHRYLPQSPERVEKLVRRAAYNKDRHALAQRDMMQQRQKTEARGGLHAADGDSPSKKGGPPVIPGLNFSSPARALPMPRSSQQSDPLHLRKKLGMKEYGFFAGDVGELSEAGGGEEKEDFMTRGGFFTPQRGLPTLASLQQKLRGASSPNDSNANDHVAMQHVGGHNDDQVHQRTVTVGRGPSTSPQKVVLPLEQRLAVTLAQTEAVKRAQEEALSGSGPAAELIKAQMLGQTPAGRSRSIAAMHEERQEFLNRWIREEQGGGHQKGEKEHLPGFMQPTKKDAATAVAAGKKDAGTSKKDATPKVAAKVLTSVQSAPDLRYPSLVRTGSLPQPVALPASVLSPIMASTAAVSLDESAKPGHRRRISHLVTASGLRMYDSPFSKPLQTIHDAPPPNGPTSVSFEPVVLESTPIKKLVYSTSSDTLPGPLVRKPSSGLIAVVPERGTLGSPEKKPRPHPVVTTTSPPSHQRSLSTEDIDPRSIVASPIAAATFTSPMHHGSLRSPIARHSPSLNNTSLGGGGPSSSYSSPFAMDFSVNSVFEKSGMHHSGMGATQSVFQSTKQHVARHTVAPLRTQLSSLVVLGDKANAVEVYENPAPASQHPGKVAHHASSRENSPPKIKQRQISTSADRLQAKLVASATLSTGSG